jgi:Ribosomal protein L41
VKDGETLSFGDISGSIMENETVVLLLDLAGGMRAKWRKKRMRRLRRKRRKMRQRAR